MSSHVPVPAIYPRRPLTAQQPIFAVLLASLVLLSNLPYANAQTTAPSAPAQGASKLDAMPKELQKIDVKQGTGAEAISGKVVVVHYTGWLYDPSKPDNKGAKFDSSRDRGQPFDFPLGGGRVIKGWDQGVVGMKVGGQRTLIIPPDMGYGARGAGGVIPPNATLMFDVELLEVK
jgi:FKBP-type peptidyl-prolyl cis-trans isomerase FkpA